MNIAPSPAVIPPSDGRAPGAAVTYPDLSSSPPPEPLLVAPPTRDQSVPRGRASSNSNVPNVSSPRGITPSSTTQSRGKQSIDLERKPSLSYGHHRQTSIVHGIQHSRNASLLTPTSSPLSPQKSAGNALVDNSAQNGELKKSPSLTQLSSGGAAGPPINRTFDINATQRRLPQRMHSGRVKRSHEHQLSVSRAQSISQEPRTVGEYALHHLFTSFIAEANERIERCLYSAGQPEPPIEPVCGPGADPGFDQLIWSLGHINRHKPASLIDSIIRWRKEKADLANVLYDELKALQAWPNHRLFVNGVDRTPTTPPTLEEIMAKEQQAGHADQRSKVSIYIICRVLIEVIGQTSLKALNGPDGSLHTARRLEEVIYSQLQNAEPDTITHSPVIRANWAIRGQLLGVMSTFRFEEVSERFIKDLEQAQKSLAIKGMATHTLARKTALLVQSMRWLKVEYQPASAWEKSCGTLHLLAKFFNEVHGRTMKHAYAELFESLLLPIAAASPTELNSPRWKETLAVLQPRTSQMMSKADHWPYVYPLHAVLLCASPEDQFRREWLHFATSFQPKVRDRSARSHALKAICRLVWRALYRISDPSHQNQIRNNLEEIVKLVFQGGKKVLVSTDPVIADPLIQLIRIIGYRMQNFCFNSIIFPLMDAGRFNAEPKPKIEHLDPERTVIGIRAFLAVMADLEKGEGPPFPTRFECDAMMDPTSRSPTSHRRTRSQGFVVSAGRTERLSRPLTTTSFNEDTKAAFVKFCTILGKLTVACNEGFGGQAALDEKLFSSTPKTPMAEAFTFSRRDDMTYPADLRQHYYDLLHVAVEALPRCLSPQLPIRELVSLLCTGTAHVQSHVAASSANSLKSIARQNYAQQVTTGFSTFIFSFDDKYATVSDGSLLGPGHIENTLKLYVELLQIWIDEIEQRAQKAVAEPTEDPDQSARALPLDLSSILAYVDDVESHGLFFLCSPSRSVRAVAVSVLRLIAKFDTALGKPTTRIISILEGGSQAVIDVDDERLTLAERSRLLKGLRKGNSDSVLVELCSSDIAHDANLWFKIFPNLVRLSAEICLHAVALTRELVCKRLAHSYKTIGMIAEGHKVPNLALQEPFNTSKPPPRLTSTSPEIIVEQWKIHLIFACTTLTNIGSTPSSSAISSQSSQHTRKSSKSSAASSEKMTSAAELFSGVVRFLSVPEASVRAAAVAGLGATNATLFQTLIEVLRPLVADCNNDAKERLASHNRTTSNPRSSQRKDHLRTEITHLLALTCPLLHDPKVQGETDALEVIMDYTRQLRLFLSDVQIQTDLEYQKLRTHFCTLVETFYSVVSKRKDEIRWMSFQSRQASFALMENWCGFSPNEPQLRRQQEHIRRSILDLEGDIRSRLIMNSAIEKERNELMFAALSAMAMMCAGPLVFMADNRVLMQFDVRRMLQWVHATFEAASDRVHAIGRKSLQNLIMHNLDQHYLMNQAIRMCYIAKSPKALASYFEVVTKVLTENTDEVVPFWRIVCAGMYTLGNENSEIRMKSTKLLRVLEERQGKTSKLQELDISVSDRTTTVYKNAQFEISRRLASQHQDLAFYVFSEFSAYFNELEPDHKRNMVSGMLPWIQTIHLQLAEQNGGPTDLSYMLLVNLFNITVRSSPTLHNEIQALWQALATGPYPANVQMVLDFVIEVCLEKREQNFVNYAKQVVVFLSKTPAGSRVTEYLLMHISTKDMATFRSSQPRQKPVDSLGLPYIADLDDALPSGIKQTGMSMGQVCMILLVDLVVAPFQLPPEKIPTLLQVALVQWDQYIDIVQENARELLVHLIHELVISKIDPERSDLDKQSIEDFIDSVRRNDPKITWSYGDQQVKPGEEHGRAVSDQMFHVVDEIVRIFGITYPGIREELGRITMEWASSCPVRHVACRSFQVYRCLSVPITRQVLADMLARLSNTIADDAIEGIRVFSLQILTTLRFILDDTGDFSRLPPETLPQIFWATCACLGSIFEPEFQEALSILDILLENIDLAAEADLDALRAAKPLEWAGEFPGLHALLYKGVRSSRSMERTLAIMDRTIQLPSSDIVGGHDRVIFTIYANLPRFLRSFDSRTRDASCVASAEILAKATEKEELLDVTRVLQGFATGRFRNEKDFLSQCVTTIRDVCHPTQDLQSLVFLLGMVHNSSPWFKIKTMQALCVLLPEIDLGKQDIACQGPDLISPLLRLLTTEHVQQALDVLDNVIEMTGTPLDNKHLRMSMVGSHSSRATRKEYENTQNLYGIPEDSGWSIPMPAIHAAATRANVHKVFSQMAHGLQGDATPTATPDVEFYREDYSLDSYFTERSASLMADEIRVEGTMGELAEKLDTLDDFFDDGPSSPHDPNASLGFPIGSSEQRESLYDQQALPILHRSLQRNASVTSFHNGFAGEHRTQQQQPTPILQVSSSPSSTVTTPRDIQSPSVMNPAAFAAQSQRQMQQHTQQPVAMAGSLRPAASGTNRPGLHSRSITSPTMPILRGPRGPASAREPPTTSLLHDFLSGDDEDDSTGGGASSFSDDDMSVGRALPLDDAFENYKNSAGLHALPYYSQSNQNVHSGAAGGSGVGNSYTIKYHGAGNNNNNNNNNNNGGTGFKAGVRAGIRRLTSTGGSREAREALRVAVVGGTKNPPKVPKVPVAYSGAAPTSAATATGLGSTAAHAAPGADRDQ